MSDTPRTDAEEHLWNGQEVGFDRMVEFARDLEREVARLNANISYEQAIVQRLQAQLKAHMHDQGVREGLHPPVPPKHKPVA